MELPRRFPNLICVGCGVEVERGGLLAVLWLDRDGGALCPDCLGRLGREGRIEVAPGVWIESKELGNGPPPQTPAEGV